MSKRPQIVLHGGFHKTATSHIQSMLARNSKMLEREGVHYVHHRDTRKQLTVPVQCNVYNKIGMDWDPKISDEELAGMSRAFLKEISKGNPKRIILSDENMAGHCGHCVKRGVLYRWRRKLLEVFAEQFPEGVSEVHLGLRNYADFFASAYVEYLRSVTGQWFVDERTMRRQVMENMPNWHNILKSVVTLFPGAKVTVWRYEDFRRMDRQVLGGLYGPGIDTGAMKEPKDRNKRPTASGRAVAELLQLIYKDGADKALEQRVALQEKFPRGPEYGTDDPWTPNERAHLTRMYDQDIADIRANPDITLLELDRCGEPLEYKARKTPKDEVADETDVEIGMLWVEGPLSYVEVLCAQSFLDAGHHVKLYHYKDVQNVPEGVELIHGDSVLKIDRFIQHGRTGSFALFSDVFRYHLLQQNDRMIWADLDADCAKPFETETGHFFGWESDTHINGGVLGLPPDSEALGQLLEMSEDEYGIPEWYSDREKAKFQEKKDAGDPVHVSDMKWASGGPQAVTHYLHKTGEAKYALPIEGLYPVGFRDRRLLGRTRAREKVGAMLTENTYSVHFYGRRIREFLSDIGGMPEPDSWMDETLRKHKIDCDAAPVLSREEKAAMKEAEAMGNVTTAPRLPTGKGGENLTDLADRYGSDKGSKKHRYTELYHMLFHPYRQRKITFLEMGLLIGGPEHGLAADRETTDCPSIRMWLDYFPKAEIHGLDVSDFSWVEHQRFTFHRCDMDERDNIAAAIEEIETAPTIVIDDASHASHHQQNAFLEIFPRLDSGGLYIIEDLRWQPDTYEQEGITKTAALFRDWVETRTFTHSDPKVAAEFNKLAEDISGVHLAPARMVPGKRLQVAVIHKK